MKALIIGSSRGLGLGLTGVLLARGWQVAGTARHPASASKLQDLVVRYPGKVQVLQADVLQTMDLDALAKLQSPGSLQLVVINAGVAGPEHQAVDALTTDELQALFGTNTIAPLRIAKRLLPALAANGTIAFMSSRLGSIADNTSGGFDLYRASKAALNSMARSFAVTAAKPAGVNVLCLHPGWVRTDMGGPHAPLSVDESVQGLASVLEAPRASGIQFLDYSGAEIPW
jgi:NAD(P)-dependent dehydrogenase (short-subunit alcohol dehydrogenase family)